MNFKKIYNSKKISLDEALSLIKSNYVVVTGLAQSESKGLMKNLHKIKDKVSNVKVYTALNMEDYDWYSSPEMEKSFLNHSWFYNASQRNLIKKGLNTITFIPNNLHMAGTDLLHAYHVNIFWGVATPMDKNGYLSLSLSVTYEKDLLENADIVVLEINDKTPFTYGDTIIHISDIDYLYEYSYDVPTLPIVPPSETDKKIAELISEEIEDGSTLQIGIGGIPNAVATLLEHKKDLGIHTEMFTEGMMELYNKGVITNKKKTFYKGKFVCTFALGSQKLYDFLDHNPGVEFIRGSLVNDPYFISKNDNFISINTALAVDLFGNVCSESFGPIHYSGTGGQLDTHRGAIMSKGGKGFIALHSTVKNNTISTIVPLHKQGASYTVPRQDVDNVVTEFGIAKLRGKSVKDRAKEIIAIAHPDFRKELEDEAKKLGIL